MGKKGEFVVQTPNKFVYPNGTLHPKQDLDQYNRQEQDTNKLIRYLETHHRSYSRLRCLDCGTSIHKKMTTIVTTTTSPSPSEAFSHFIKNSQLQQPQRIIPSTRPNLSITNMVPTPTNTKATSTPSVDCHNSNSDNSNSSSSDDDIGVILDLAQSILSSPTASSSEEQQQEQAKASASLEDEATAEEAQDTCYLPELLPEDIITIESTLVDELSIHFLHARNLSVQTRLELGIKGYPSKIQCVAIVQHCMKLFHEQPLEMQEAMKQTKHDFDTNYTRSNKHQQELDDVVSSSTTHESNKKNAVVDLSQVRRGWSMIKKTTSSAIKKPNPKKLLRGLSKSSIKSGASTTTTTTTAPSVSSFTQDHLPLEEEEDKLLEGITEEDAPPPSQPPTRRRSSRLSINGGCYSGPFVVENEYLNDRFIEAIM